MKHKDVEEKLIFYLESSLTDEEEKSIAAHLDSCEACQFYLNKLTRDFELLVSEKKIEEADPYFYTRLKARMKQQKQSETFFVRLVQPVLFSLFLIGAMSVGITIGKHLNDQIYKQESAHVVLLPFDGMKEEPIEQFLLTLE